MWNKLIFKCFVVKISFCPSWTVFVMCCVTLLMLDLIWSTLLDDHQVPILTYISVASLPQFYLTLCMCMCVHVYALVFASVYMCIFCMVYIHVHTCMYTHMYMCVDIYYVYFMNPCICVLCVTMCMLILIWALLVLCSMYMTICQHMCKFL